MACTIFKTGCEHPEVAKLTDQLKQHPAWRDSLSLKEIEGRLTQASYYSFFLIPARQEGFYYLSFLGKDDQIHYHLFRIVTDKRGKMGFKNGTHMVYQDIDDLVPSSIGCASSSCHPCE